MHISAKGILAINVLMNMVPYYNSNELVSANSLADELNTTKVYMEKILAYLRGQDLIIAEKGVAGGYKLCKAPKEITIYSVLMSCENYKCNRQSADLFETFLTQELEMPIEELIRQRLLNINLALLYDKYHYYKSGNWMYYI